MSMTKEQRRKRRDRFILRFGWCLIAASITWLLIVLITQWVHNNAGVKQRSVCVTRIEGVTSMCADIIERPDESEMIAEAVEASIGTDYEETCLGYHIEPVFLAVMGEGGAESDWYIRQLATCVANEARFKNTTPEQAVADYQFQPADEYSSRVREIVIDVLIYGNVAEDVGNATIFYNVDDQYEMTGHVNDYHELQHEVLEVETRRGRVRFYEEVT